jgi:hypothetical protein
LANIPLRIEAFKEKQMPLRGWRTTAKAFYDAYPPGSPYAKYPKAIFKLRGGVWAEGRLSGPELEGRLLYARPSWRNVVVDRKSGE